MVSPGTTTTADFLVIGGGMAGLSAAYELSAHGRVVVLEREEQPGYHATGRSAALLIETYGPLPIRILTAASRPAYLAFAEGFAPHPVALPRGVLFFGTDEQSAVMDQHYHEVRRVTGSVERPSAEETLAKAPMLKPEAVAGGGVWEPDAVDLDVHAILMAYLRGLRQRGGRLVGDAEARAIHWRSGAWHVDTSAGRFEAPILVNAAGAWADEVAGLAGLGPLGLTPKRRTAILFDPVLPPEEQAPGNIGQWPMVVEAEERVYFKPESGRLLASPADATPSPACDAQPEDEDVAIAVDRLETAARFRIPRIARRWAGLRSFFPDGVPAIGFDPRVNGFFWLAGQGGYGIQTAPALARAVAGLIAEGVMPHDLEVRGLSKAMLGPARFLNQDGRPC